MMSKLRINLAADKARTLLGGQPRWTVILCLYRRVRIPWAASGFGLNPLPSLNSLSNGLRNIFRKSVTQLIHSLGF